MASSRQEDPILMRRRLRILAALCLAALPVLAQERNAGLHALFHDYYEWQLREFPEMATSVGRTEYNDRWTDLSPEALNRRLQTIRDFRAKLKPFDSANLNEQDRLSYQLLDRELRIDEEGFPMETWYMAVSHFRGPHLAPASIINQMPAQTVQDYEKILARLRALPALADHLSQLAKAAAEKNLVQPKRVAELTIRQIRNQASTPALKSPLLRPFTNFPPSFSEAEQQRLRSAAVDAYEQGFVPAWNNLHREIAQHYLPKARSSTAVTDANNGREMYRFAVRRHTTTNYTPEQIHGIGLKEVDRIEKEMAAIRKEVGFSGTAEEFVTRVLEAPDRMFKSEEEILRHGRDIAKRLDPELPKLFKVLPRMPYGVRPIPPERAQTAAPYYEPPALDGTRAGYLYLRTYQPEKQSRCCMEALIIHEAVPGHHLQVALARELEGFPEFRKVAFFPAFLEGWALYAETLGPHLGMYKSPHERYGKLQNEMMRAIRLVVDTGIHAMGWPREKAVNLMKLAKGGFITDEFIESEVDRYITWPGQALAYKMGALKIAELRAMAEKELGSKFDVREFHHAVLRNGALPLDLLEEQVGAYIANARA
jgi:uncharacterized protein (DUF885 family)